MRFQESSPSIAPAFDMMRYQRLSPDCLPLPTATGRKPENQSTNQNSNPSSNHTRAQSPSSPNDASKSLRGRPPPPPSPPSLETTASSAAQNHASTSTSGHHGEMNGGDLLLQWGHNKRSRGPRSTQAGDDSSSHPRPPKIPRRPSSAAAIAAEKLMPPPRPPATSAGVSYTRGANLRPPSSPVNHRAVDERSGGHTRSEKRSHQEKPAHKTNGYASHHHSSSEAAMNHHHHQQSDAKQHQPSDHDPSAGSNGGAGGEKLSLEHFEWPRIYISLSRKEKEDDFLAMKGTKLPQRPKKRAKNVDKTLQYCFPGMWLSDLTRGRYEVREKKCVKKQKRRGLKGMESMDSDSE